MERVWALLAVLGIAALSVLKGYFGIDDASTSLLAAMAGGVMGYYFGANSTPPPEA